MGLMSKNVQPNFPIVMLQLRTTTKKPKDLILAERCIAIIIVIHLQRGNCNIKYKSLLLTRPQKADATNRKQTSAEKINPAL